MLLDFIEKFYKKNFKKGLPISVALDFDSRIATYGDKDYNGQNTIVISVAIWNDEIQKKVKAENPGAKIFTVYKGLEDFIIE